MARGASDVCLNMAHRVAVAFAGLRSHRIKELRTSMDEDRGFDPFNPTPFHPTHFPVQF